MNILMHDDFDGAASAAFLAVILGETEGPCKYIAVDYGVDIGWGEPSPTVAAGETFAVVDFEYHPNARYYFDHHPTAFQRPGARAHFDARVTAGDRLVAWAPTPSCADLIYDYLPREVKLQYAPLRAAANRIDRAQYATPDEYFQAPYPEIQLSHGWHRLTAREKTQVIEKLGVPDLAAATQVAPQKLAAAIAENLMQLDQLQEYMECRGNTVLVDAVRGGLGFQRFAPYYYYPAAEYALTIYASGPDVRVGLGKNPWLDFEPQDLGRLAQELGGGGHPFAAGAIARQADYPMPYAVAWQFVARAARQLNQPALALAA